jgi:hypothetical protein
MKNASKAFSMIALVARTGKICWRRFGSVVTSEAGDDVSTEGTVSRRCFPDPAKPLIIRMSQINEALSQVIWKPAAPGPPRALARQRRRKRRRWSRSGSESKFFKEGTIIPRREPTAPTPRCSTPRADRTRQRAAGANGAQNGHNFQRRWIFRMRRRSSYGKIR